MLNDDLEVYDSCDLQKPNISSRSRLYNLEPIGIGTPNVESLTGFLIRLAEAHCLEVNVLISQEISTHIDKKYIQNNYSKGLSTLLNRGVALSSKGILAVQLFQSLEKLTLRKNLSCLTLSSFKEFFSTRNLHCQSKAWCPACYEQWRIAGKFVYEPLLWTIADVKVCPHHHQPLQTICPHCDRPIPWLIGKSRIGHCSNCDRWLGSFSQISTKNNTGYGEAEFAKNIWIAKTLGELISSTSIASCFVHKAHIPKALNQIIDATYQGNITAFARAFGLPKNTVWMWCKGKSTPELRILLTICYGLDISLLDFFLLKEKAFESLQIDAQKLPTAPRSKRKSPKVFDYEAVETYLETILNNPDISPPTMKEVAESLGLHRRTISGYFPSLCKRISAKYSTYQKLNKAKRIRDCCQEIEQAVLSIYKSGEYPTEARVSQLISQPGYFRYKEVRDTLNKAVANVTFKP
jgi:transcriptional regulator with XRE-family HTH domain